MEESALQAARGQVSTQEDQDWVTKLLPLQELFAVCMTDENAACNYYQLQCELFMLCYQSRVEGTSLGNKVWNLAK